MRDERDVPRSLEDRGKRDGLAAVRDERDDKRGEDVSRCRRVNRTATLSDILRHW